MQLNAESEFASHERASRPRKHSDSLPRRKKTEGIDPALRQLYQVPIPRQTLLELFEHRAPYGAINAWRFGWRDAPDWALEIVKRKLCARIAELERAAVALKPRKKPHGWRGKQNLSEWRVRQAEEREKKRAAEAALAQSRGERDD
jgi:hypothetical protein